MPVVLSAAGDVPGIKPSDAIAIVTAVTYLGFLCGPPFFGYMGDLLGAIRWSLLLCACVIALVVVLPGSPPRNRRCLVKEQQEGGVSDRGEDSDDDVRVSVSSPLNGKDGENNDHADIKYVQVTPC